MNARMEHVLSGMRVLSIVILVAAGFVVWQRRRIKDWMARRPPPKPPKHFWIGPAIGAILGVAFALSFGAYTGMLSSPVLRGVYIAAVILAFVTATPAGIFLTRRQQE